MAARVAEGGTLAAAVTYLGHRTRDGSERDLGGAVGVAALTGGAAQADNGSDEGDVTQVDELRRAGDDNLVHHERAAPILVVDEVEHLGGP